MMAHILGEIGVYSSSTGCIEREILKDSATRSVRWRPSMEVRSGYRLRMSTQIEEACQSSRGQTSAYLLLRFLNQVPEPHAAFIHTGNLLGAISPVPSLAFEIRLWHNSAQKKKLPTTIAHPHTVTIAGYLQSGLRHTLLPGIKISTHDRCKLRQGSIKNRRQQMYRVPNQE